MCEAVSLIDNTYLLTTQKLLMFERAIMQLSLHY